MNLLDEIRHAEEKAARLKADAEKKGAALVANTRAQGEEALRRCAADFEGMHAAEIKKADQESEQKTHAIDEAQAKEVEAIRAKSRAHRARALVVIQELLQQWPSSR